MTAPRRSDDRLRTADARNRALRTVLQGLAVDVSVAVGLVLYDVTRAGDADWRLLPALVAKTAATSAAAYVMRTRLDPSRVPTPLPPDPPGEPDRDQPRGY